MRLRWLLLVAVLLLGSAPVEAQKAGRQQSVQSLRQSRPVGHRHKSRMTRREAKRFRYEDTNVLIPKGTEKATREVENVLGLAKQGTLGDRLQVERIFTGGKPDRFGGSPDHDTIYRIDIKGTRATAERARRTGKGRNKRKAKSSRPFRILLVTGLHGDEKAGPLSTMNVVRRAIKDKDFQRKFDQLTVFVRIDPRGTRLRSDGVNLNRHAAPGKFVSETWAIHKSLGKQKYDLLIDVHQAGQGPTKAENRQGAFLIRAEPYVGSKLSRRVLSAMNSHQLLDAPPGKSSVGPYELHMLGGVRGGIELTSQPSATFKEYGRQRGIPHSFTLEGPRTVSPKKQVAWQTKLIYSTIFHAARYGARAE